MWLLYHPQLIRAAKKSAHFRQLFRNQGGQQNVATMLLFLVDNYFKKIGLEETPPVETPATGPAQLVAKCSLIAGGGGGA